MTSYSMPRPPASTPPLYAQDGQGYDALVHAHYFLGGSDWLVTEYNPDEDVAFGWCCLAGDRQNAELGYVNLGELETVAVPLRAQVAGQVWTLGDQHVEQEADWLPMPLHQAVALLDARQGRDR